MKSIKARGMKEGTVLMLIAIPFLVYIFAFSYVPLFGWLYAFVDFRPALGPNPFIYTFKGLTYFTQMWSQHREVTRVLINTLAMSGLSLLTSPLSVVLAILMMEIRGNKLKRVVQTVTTFPNFISWIIVFGIAYSFFSNDGVFASFKELLGFPQQTIGLLANANAAWVFQTVLGLWKAIGWSAIIYCAAISGIDESLYEAARVDGASKIQCIRYITIPGVAETFLVLFLLGVSNVLSNNFDQIFVFNNPMVTSKLMNLDLYVYRIGITQNQYSFSIAVGITRAFIGLALLFIANWVSKKIRGVSLV